MGKLGMAILVGLVGAIVVHIAVIFTIPNVADNNAWGRLSRLGEPFTFVRIDALRRPGPAAASPDAGSQDDGFAFVDPGFITSGCRFSLEDGPSASPLPVARPSGRPRSTAGKATISIRSTTDRPSRAAWTFSSAPRSSSSRRGPTRRTGGETAIPVEVPIEEGYITLRVLVDEESVRPEVDAFVRSVVCEPADPATAGDASPPSG